MIGFLEEDVGNFEAFQPSVDEVDKVFTVPIERLLDPTFRGVEKFRMSPSIESPYFGTKGDEECVWGLTGKILDIVRSELILKTRPQ